jgi:signal peptidase I
MIPDPSARRAGGAPPARPTPYLLPAEPDEYAIHGFTRGAKSVAQELLEAVLLSVVIFFLVQMAIQNRVVLGQSMEPTLRNDERLFIDRVSYLRIDAGMLGGGVPGGQVWLLGGPQRGDIVVFHPPVEGEKDDYIKRVIAVAGEQVEVRAYKGVYVNGRLLSEPYIKDTPDYSWPALGESGVVPPGHVFVLGDNRRNSSDSHLWGFLDAGRIVGKAVVSYWPEPLIGILPHPAYADLSSRPAGP